MTKVLRKHLLMPFWASWAVCFLSAGCASMQMHQDQEIIPAAVPKELNKVSLPSYVIEPPDILLIDAVRTIPQGPYKVAPLDALLIQASGVLPTDPIAGIYNVDPEGTVNLGLEYGSIRVAGFKLEEARAKIEEHLKLKFKEPKVVVSVAQTGAQQQIRGEHLVRPDGTVGLGTYGNVYVTGMTLTEAKAAIENHLKKYLEEPKISVDVYAYNSKVYYVITDGGGFGEQVTRFPSTGNETVLDAISQINGLPSMASKKHIWIARPAPGGGACSEQTLPVDWCAITRKGATDTNYQVLPGDRIYVQADPLIRFDNAVSKIVTPIERMFGVTLLGAETIGRLHNVGANTGTGNNGRGF